MSCPTGDLETGATKPITMFRASDVDAADACPVAVPMEVMMIKAIITANIFFCIPSILSFFIVYQAEQFIKLTD
jgi:hypothetical protein